VVVQQTQQFNACIACTADDAYFNHISATLPAFSQDNGYSYEMVIDGIKTNIPLQARIMADETFRKGGMNIHYLEKMLGELWQKISHRTHLRLQHLAKKKPNHNVQPKMETSCLPVAQPLNEN
jgi:pyruvate carboxylase